MLEESKRKQQHPFHAKAELVTSDTRVIRGRSEGVQKIDSLSDRPGLRDREEGACGDAAEAPANDSPPTKSDGGDKENYRGHLELDSERQGQSSCKISSSNTFMDKRRQKAKY